MSADNGRQPLVYRLDKIERSFYLLHLMDSLGYSRTAEFMALFRALESAAPAGRRLFTDTHAHGFLRPSLRAAAVLARIPFVNSILSRFIDKRWPGARSSGIARTRYIDEIVSDTVSGGISQLVILGAGFDSRAWRLPALSKVIVFEVDHPNTSRLKHRLMGALAAQVRYVALDFNQQRLHRVLPAAGLDLARPALFLWEGVTQYLTAEAVDSTFRFVTTAAAGSRILFTYVHAGVLKEPSEFANLGALHSTLSNSAEPWTFGFDPSELPSYLEARGLALISDRNATDYRAAYPGLDNTGYEFYRVAMARVVG